MNRQFFVWWQSAYGPELRRFDSASQMMHFIIGWSMTIPTAIYPERCTLDGGGFQLTSGV